MKGLGRVMSPTERRCLERCKVYHAIGDAVTHGPQEQGGSTKLLATVL